MLVRFLYIAFKYNVRSLKARWVTTFMTVLGTGLVVWASVLSFGLAAGLDETLNLSSDPLDVIVIRKGSDAETASMITPQLARQILAMPGIATTAKGEIMGSAELLAIVNSQRRDGTSANLIVRGVSDAAFELRNNFKIVAGRMFRTGVHEVITSRAIAARFKGAGLGETMKLFGKPFQVVGTFEASGSAAESEVWTDVATFSQASKRDNMFSSVQLRAVGLAEVSSLIKRLESDEEFEVKALTEKAYFAEQELAGAAIKIVGIGISIILTAGAMFAVANTMYGAVASRAREIGTLRAIGFSRSNVMFSFISESLVLCMLGGALGCVATLPLQGLSTGTANWVTFSEITFAFHFSPSVMMLGAFLAVLMGVIGGIAPAIRAIRMNVVEAIRDIG